jgi:hypothetical protein
MYAVSGAGCAGSGCGAVDSGGHFTAPQILPSPAMVTLTAQSAADPAKRTAASIRITSSFTLTMSGPSSAAPGSSSPFTATFSPAQNSNPSLAMQWQLSGAGCAGSGCGTLQVTAALSAAGQQPAGLGIIHLTLQISSAAVTGPRTLFIENSNRDKTAATGAVLVK